MERTVVIGFFVLLALLIGGNLIITCSINRHIEPNNRAQAAAKANQAAIVVGGVLDRVWDSSDEAERLKLLSAALDPKALDVRGAPLTLERARIVGEVVAVDMRSAGRDGMAGTSDDVVIMVSFARADGTWYAEGRDVIEYRGKRTEIDLKAWKERDGPR